MLSGLRFAIKSRLPRAVPFYRGAGVPAFFIVGSGRSGSTFLRKQLMLYYRVFIPPETYVIGPIIREFTSRPLMAWPSVVDLTISKIEDQPEFGAFGVESLSGVRKTLLALPQQRQTLENAISAFYRFLAENSGFADSIWGDKTPVNVFYLNEIERTFPAARFIFLHRDGVDAAVSYVKAGLYPTLEPAAKRWVAANEAALRFLALNRDKVFQVGYEQLVTNQADTHRKIAQFLGIEQRVNPALKKTESLMQDVKRYPHLRSVPAEATVEFIGKGRRGLNRDDLLALSPIMDGMLMRLGYSRCN